ncbi:MAG: flagellar protein, FliL [Methanobrevibacter sp.]|uniref:flagellar protein, FliL n=1 Tax=Methanobrevibacter sp. TaxID=66852 RepID=UPI0025DECABB|nr:flagellar protein, FliL [Methanobrevibacter sp.]MBQ6098522.1 flagellar protein, FliL [Methanobrevibacter sp.]
MKSFIVILLGIIVALLVVGGVVAYSFMDGLGVNMENIDSNIEKINNKVSNVASSESSDSSSSGDGGIVSEIVKFNEQNGEGYYREVTYKDGGFRQYDAESGKLIGSSYGSDQANLPSLE